MTPIPNTFQTPNEYVDRAMQYLENDELRCLLFATRHILGWKDRIDVRSASISLTMFEKGFKSKKTDAVFSGCGLPRPAIKDATDSLVVLGFLIRVGEPTQDGQEWKLGTEIDWSALEDRYAKRKDTNRKRVEKAAKASQEKRLSGTPDVPASTSHVPPDQYVPRTTTGTPDVPQGSTPDVLKQTHASNPSTNTIKDSADAADDIPVKGIADSHLSPEASAATQPNTPPSSAAPPKYGPVFEAWALHNFDYTDVSKVDPAHEKQIWAFVWASRGAYQFQFDIQDEEDTARAIHAFCIDWRKVKDGKPFSNAVTMRNKLSPYLQAKWKRVAKPIAEQSEETDDTQDDSDVINDIVSSLASLGQMKGVKNVPAA